MLFVKRDADFELLLEKLAKMQLKEAVLFTKNSEQFLLF